jgi:sulfur carrier protein
MRITVNGEDKEAEEGETLAGLLDRFGFKPQATVVERNGVIVDRANYGAETLTQGDALELVRFVGGG